MNINIKTIYFSVLVSFFVFTSVASADTLGQREVFFVNESFDEYKREAIVSNLKLISNNAYFYVDDRYWNSLSFDQKTKFENNLKDLGAEFDNNIYKKETLLWGSENKPGVDNDPRITVLLHDLTNGTGGYFESIHSYKKSNEYSSNQREMIFVNAESLLIPNQAQGYLAHEFQHLISFYQKEMLRNTPEEVWLNELRSEYSISHIGYNDIYEGSSLESRVFSFLRNPSDSLVEWTNKSVDYGSVALFAEYLVERYGPEIISESLKSSNVGISSINEYLAKKDGNSFTNVFSDWLITLILNNKNINPNYGYSDPDLSNVRVNIENQIHFLTAGKYSLQYLIKPFQPQWYRYAVNQSIANDHYIQLTPTTQAGFRLIYIDNLNRVRIVDRETFIEKNNQLKYFYLIPIYYGKNSGFSDEESVVAFPVSIEFPLSIPQSAILKDGDLIKRPNESEIYVIWGKYRRYLSPEVINLYGHLDSKNAIEVTDEIFNSYTTSNYIRSVNNEKVFTIWPDNTKHWLNISEEIFRSTGRDANSIFTVSDLEINFYETGSDITR